MQKTIYLAVVFIWISFHLNGQTDSVKRNINYDESLVSAYTLPDLLTSNSGLKINNKQKWEQIRRPEILEMYSNLVYGRTPTEDIPVSYQLLTENKHALDGKATMRQVKMTFSKNGKTVNALLLLMLPNHIKKKIPMIIGYNFKGNHSTINDSTILYSDNFKLVREPDHLDWKRGVQAQRWDYKQIIERGYGVATMCYHDIFPDKDGFKDYSIAALFSDYESRKEQGDNWEAIGGWAWGSSRIVDYLETIPEIDKNKFALLGHSRQGKAALWAGAQDPRFSIVISNNSGEGGAALARRNYGETLQIVCNIKPAWFAKNLNAYHHKIDEMPFDQHMLIALIAPRAVYVASAEQDRWADPKGEYLAAYHASPVYALYKKKGLPSEIQPQLHQPIYNDIGYHIRAGIHDVNSYDWYCYLNFADKKWK
ncbi:MAG: acetylxylan esterase [Sphingobacterium hotanense]